MDKEQIALSAGWSADEDQSHLSLIDPEDRLLPKDVENERPWTSKPLPRTLLVGGITFATLAVLLKLTSGPEPSTAQNSNPEISGETTEIIEQMKQEIKDLRGQNALQQQAIELENIKKEELQQKKKGGKKPTKTPPTVKVAKIPVRQSPPKPARPVRPSARIAAAPPTRVTAPIIRQNAIPQVAAAVTPESDPFPLPHRLISLSQNLIQMSC